jgi:hypothetical protein
VGGGTLLSSTSSGTGSPPAFTAATSGVSLALKLPAAEISEHHLVTSTVGEWSRTGQAREREGGFGVKPVAVLTCSVTRFCAWRPPRARRRRR